MWLGEKGCKQIVKETWRGGSSQSSMGEVDGMIKSCSQQLELWNKHVFGNVHKKLQKAQQNLKLLQESDPYGIDKETVSKAGEEVQIWLEREETIWK